MVIVKVIGLVVLLVGYSAPVFSADETESADQSQYIPPLPPALAGDESFDPEVTIIKKTNEVHYEYRVNGQVYMVRIEPDIGPAYYLLDSNGDGELDVRENDPRNISVPQWILFRW